ncbi:hypothetical protein [Virgibacillus oceani]|uniref:Uncharacterized protein n=1 Tax=Virgibacillus oceani TaxID=1479511 RepID=A0A917HK22_9BACI|nr:hypothetical protein [Virgibacillus oceani]GGG81578.1 hypothetical protein GCM10011398_28820 [Virgibacillus oceani]
MVGTVVVGYTFIALAGLICVFLSVLSAIYAISYSLNQKGKQKFKGLAFTSAILTAIAYFILIFILDA